MSAELNITITGKVIKNILKSGMTKDGKKFSYNRLVVETNNGSHWEHIDPRSTADNTTMVLFSKAKEGDIIQASNCFIDSFIYDGKALTQIRAGKLVKLNSK